MITGRPIQKHLLSFNPPHPSSAASLFLLYMITTDAFDPCANLFPRRARSCVASQGLNSWPRPSLYPAESNQTHLGLADYIPNISHHLLRPGKHFPPSTDRRNHSLMLQPECRITPFGHQHRLTRTKGTVTAPCAVPLCNANPIAMFVGSWGD